MTVTEKKTSFTWEDNLARGLTTMSVLYCRFENKIMQVDHMVSLPPALGFVRSRTLRGRVNIVNRGRSSDTTGPDTCQVKDAERTGDCCQVMEGR